MIDKVKKEWIIVEEMPDYYPMMSIAPMRVKESNEFLEFMSINFRFSELVLTFTSNICGLLVIKKEFDSLSREVISKLEEGPEWMNKYLIILKTRENKLYKSTEELSNTNLMSLSDKELYELYNEYYFNIYTPVHICHWVQTASDFGDNLLTKHLMKYLSNKVKNSEYSLGDVFSVLTTPIEESKPMEEYKNLLSILKYINKKKNLKGYFRNTEPRIILEELAGKDKELSSILDKHINSYGWLGYNTVGPGWKKDYFIDILASLIRQNSDPDELLIKIEKNKEDLKKRQKLFINLLEIDKKHEDIFESARKLVFSKGTRKDSMFFSWFIISNLFREIGRRKYLSLQQVRYLHPNEFKELLLEKRDFSNILNERYKNSVYIADKEGDKFLVGNDAQKLIASINILKENISNVKVFYGDCASPGRSRGTVKIINISSDMDKMEKGDVLASIATTPELMPAIKKASVIVTDVGGITCHAAIISRELGIPCVVGTKIATKVLKDGDVVDVNATHGRVSIVSKGK